MAAIHSAAELEALKALLAAGLSRSEIGFAVKGELTHDRRRAS